MTYESVGLGREEILEVLAQNGEMRRLLEENQWSGLTPIKSAGVCPVCCGSARGGHRPDCARRAILDARTSWNAVL